MVITIDIDKKNTFEMILRLVALKLLTEKQFNTFNNDLDANLSTYFQYLTHLPITVQNFPPYITAVTSHLFAFITTYNSYRSH